MPHTRELGPPRRSTAFALLGTIQVTLIFTLAAIAVPLPRIGRELGVARADLILLSAAYGLTFAGLLLLGGRVADRYGARNALTAGLLVFAVASAAAPLAPTYATLLGARFAQGVGAAVVTPAAMAALRTVFPGPAAYGRAMATWGGLSIIGATTGNLLSGVLSALWSWRLALAAPLLVAAAGLVLVPRLLPVTPPTPGRRLDLRGAVLATGGVTAASYGLVMTDARAWTSAQVLVPLSAGVVLLAAFAAAERRTPDPLLPPGFLRDGRRRLGLAAISLTASGTALTFVLLSLRLQQERGWSALATSAAFVPFAVSLLTAGRAAGALTGRYGAPRVTGAGLTTGAAGLALLAATGFTTLPYAYGLLPGLVLLPAGAALSFAGASVLATEGVPQSQSGLAGGSLNTAMELGPTALFALLLTLGGDPASMAATAALFAVLAALTLARTRAPARPTATAGGPRTTLPAPDSTAPTTHLTKGVH
ncbi:Multidrug resistance protein stp [Streptomyces sp. YIM 130001]|uniref:MFS transporter n=1 Tax=Streptomyces sp. YIM 130001 TaxID=2259644 RepID=UPI000E648CD6|nr:MFS transporter [Streptomyces sp. YIM 130001]RII20939.1 Multidrug resistance protein stp [Streptomyces sp. YIM 130001]